MKNTIISAKDITLYSSPKWVVRDLKIQSLPRRAFSDRKNTTDLGLL